VLGTQERLKMGLILITVPDIVCCTSHHYCKCQYKNIDKINTSIAVM